MKRCLNCRKTYEKDLSECPYCGYKPRSKAGAKSNQTTQEFDAVTDAQTDKKNKSEKMYTQLQIIRVRSILKAENV